MAALKANLAGLIGVLKSFRGRSNNVVIQVKAVHQLLVALGVLQSVCRSPGPNETELLVRQTAIGLSRGVSVKVAVCDKLVSLLPFKQLF